MYTEAIFLSLGIVLGWAGANKYFSSQACSAGKLHRQGGSHMSYFNETLGRAPRDFDFTRKATKEVREIIASEEFQNLDDDAIYNHLTRKLKLVHFNDQLKRYIYRIAEMEEPFGQVTDTAYMSIIDSMFDENNAPHAFKKTTTPWKTTMKSWLTREHVSREAVFAMGFGLRMPAQDVSMLLMKANMDEDFNAFSTEETIYRYCYDHDLPYARALKLIAQAEALPAGSYSGPEPKEKFSFADERELLDYIQQIRDSGKQDAYSARKTLHFMEAYNKARDTVAAIYLRDEEEKPEKSRRTWSRDDISSYDVEKVLCCGIPMDDNGNLSRFNNSTLYQQFEKFRPNRQRFIDVMKQRIPVSRFDIITLQFLTYSQMDIDPKDRLMQYLDETNQMLTDCGMMELYSVNPYEVFIILCLASQVPLAMYADVWEHSYADGTGSPD